MENEFDYCSTFVYYDNEGRRLSIFGEDNGDGTLDITILPCNRKDEFSRKVGRSLYENGAWKGGEVVNIPIEEGMPKRTFMKYCRERFFQVRRITVPVEVEIYIKKDDYNKLGDMDKYLGEKQ